MGPREARYSSAKALPRPSCSLIVEGLAGLAQGDLEIVVDADDALLAQGGQHHGGLEVVSGLVLGLLEILRELLDLGQLGLVIRLLLRSGEVVGSLLLRGSSALGATRAANQNNGYITTNLNTNEHLHLQHLVGRALG